MPKIRKRVGETKTDNANMNTKGNQTEQLDENQIEKLIVNNPKINSFINNDEGMLPVSYRGEPIYIIKEEIGVQYYFKLPYSEGVCYEKIDEFMQICVKIISRLVEEKRKKDLMSGQNAYLR